MIKTKRKKHPLGFFPTPLHKLNNLSARYQGHALFIKRDDHTGLATGGNKTRKLEYLLGEALQQGADTIVTAGAQQSNHCRQTAAACAEAGLPCHLLLGGDPPGTFQGNLLLSKLFGANIHFTGESRKGEDLVRLAGQLKSEGRVPYVIPYGGSNLTGAMGYVEAAGELKKQLDELSLQVDYIFFASSSGGMQAGLVLGSAIHGLKARLMPVQIDKQETMGLSLEEMVRDIVGQGVRELAITRPVNTGNMHTLPGYADPGYAVVTRREQHAINTLARAEGILLDPVYTGRAFFGMIDHLENNLLEKGSTVLFWHTGGTPANFFHAPDLFQPDTD